MERTDKDIKVWFWPRSAEYVPGQVEFSASNGVIEPDAWVRASGNGYSLLC